MSSWPPPPANPSPYASSAPDPYGPPPKKGSLLWLWILLGVGGIGMLVCCGGLVAVSMFGLNVMAAEVADQVRDVPAFREHIGELESLDVDFVASSAKGDEETFVYNAKGSKGTGVLTVKQTEDEDWNALIEEASLRLPDGREVPILP
jgi:hypothetical protein